MGGGVKPPRVTEERKPWACMARRSRRWRLVAGTEVRPSRALEAFCRCEQTCERLTSDMVRAVQDAMSPRGLWGVFTSCRMGGLEMVSGWEEWNRITECCTFNGSKAV